MQISARGLALIRQFEGCELEAYLCPSRVPTIGYGHTLGVKLGMRIDQDRAEEFLRIDVRFAEHLVNSRVKVALTQGQFDALVSFVFNIANPEDQFTGENCMLLRQLNAGDYAGAAGQFGRWVYGGGKALAGLVRRRAFEEALFRA
jgi:lysozyme